MEFDTHGGFNGDVLAMPVHRLIPEKITVIPADTFSRMSQRVQSSLEAVVDLMGQRSAKAQGLGSVITTVKRMMYTDHKLFVHRGDRTINGILKIGKKKLFHCDSKSGKMHEIEPLCVLDFYVHESMQRAGVGKQLFEFMLQHEGVKPHVLGYDRPSPKLIGFLRKHYNLTNYDPQANNFVVFSSYFTSQPTRPRGGGAHAQEAYKPQEHQQGPPLRPQQAASHNHSQQHQPYDGFGGRGGHGRPSHKWWHDSGVGMSSQNQHQHQQPSLFSGGGDGGGHSAAPSSSTGRDVPASAPAGLQSLGGVTGFSRGDGGHHHAMARNIETAAPGGRGGLGGGDDSLSSFARFATGGGSGAGGAGAPGGGRRGVFKAVQEQVNVTGGGMDLQEMASSRIGGRKFAGAGGGGGGGGGGDMYQRSSNAYGSSSMPQPVKQQQQHYQQSSSSDASLMNRAPYDVSSSGNGWKYNPYEQLGLSTGGRDYAPLSAAARNDRQTSTRLW